MPKPTRSQGIEFRALKWGVRHPGMVTVPPALAAAATTSALELG